jgi:tetratricopeptide (TPR) repeat protein
MAAILDGRFSAAESLAGEARPLGKQTHGDEVEGVYAMQMFAIRREQGRLAEVAPVVKHLIEQDSGKATWLPGFALVATDLGYLDAAQRRLDQLAENGFEMPLDARRSTSLSFLAEVAATLGDIEAAQTLYDLLLAYEEMTITAGVSTVCFGSASRFLGILSATLGNFSRASRHFEHAIAMDSASRSRPWLAHAQADYASLLLKVGDKKSIAKAMALSDLAWATAGELDMVRLKRKLRPTLH